MANEIAKLFVTLGLDDKRFQASLKKVQGNLSAAGKAMTGIGVGITASLGITTKMAADFDTAMREVNTMMGLSNDEFKNFSAQVKQMSTDMGVNAVESAEALYQAISAGVPKENAIEFLQIATKAAIGGVTDTETAVDGLTTVLNAFKMPMSDAESVADIMFTTVKDGKNTFEELSASLFNVVPLAATAGIGFDEVSAGIATMSKQGIKTAQATTQMRQAIVALIKPSADMSKTIQGLGYESGEAMLAELGFAETLNKLRESTGGNNEMLGKMFGSVEGLNAVLSLTGENAGSFIADLNDMKDSAGAVVDAFNEMEKGAARVFKSIKATLQSLAITIGVDLLPIIKELVKKVKPVIQNIIDWTQQNPGLTKTLVLVAAAIGAVFAILGPLLIMLPMFAAGFSLMLGPVGLAIAAIAGLIAVGVLLAQNWEEIKAKATEIGEGIKMFFLGLWVTIGDIFKEHWDKILAILFPAVGIPILIARNWDKVKDALLTPVRAAAQGIEDAINWIIRSLNSLKFSVPNWIPGMGGKEFGLNIPEIQLPKFAHGGLINEPTLLYGLRSREPYAIAGEAGPEVVSPMGSAVITNNFNISGLVVRNETDIQRIARELFRLQQSKARSQGIA